MKSVAKILAVVLMAVVTIAVGRSVYFALATSPTDRCPVLGNHLIDNINPQVLKNLREIYRLNGGKDDCWLVNAFLLRTYDLIDNATSPPKLRQFFETAVANQILPTIRIAGDGSDYDGVTHWNQIFPGNPSDTCFDGKTDHSAYRDANCLNEAVKGLGFPRKIYAHLGNEPNLNVEWCQNMNDATSCQANPESYADSLMAFAAIPIKDRNFGIILPPVSLLGGTADAPGVDPAVYWQRLFAAVKKKNNFTCSQTVNWFNEHIDGYAFVVISADTAGVSRDFAREIEILRTAGNGQGGCPGSGFPMSGKALVVTELGIPGGVSEPNIGYKLWTFYQELFKVNTYGAEIAAVTTFVRESNNDVRAFYYIVNPDGSVQVKEYDKSKINLGGSTTYGAGGNNVDRKNADVIARYPPLGTLEACPKEIPVIANGSKTGSVPTPQGLCNIEPAEEPASCKNLEAARKSQDFCSREESGYCYPESCSNMNDSDGKFGGLCNKNDCGGDWFGRIVKAACLANKGEDNPWYQSWVAYQAICINKTRGPTNEDIFKIGSDKRVIEACLGYYLSKNPPKPKNVKPLSPNNLPACIPTTKTAGQCVSECSEPIDLTQKLIMTPSKDCYRTASGSCTAEIKIKEKSFTIPIAKDLADYFGGTLDGELSSKEQFATLSAAIRNGPRDPNFAQAQIAAGVVRKLMPPEVQDARRCEFIEYVKNQKKKIETDLADGKYDDTDRQTNTKYVWLENGKLKVFEIFGKVVTEIPCRSEIKDKGERDSFDSTWGRIWPAVPLYSNDEAAGEIKFISPSLFTIQPINVSIPEVSKLNSVSNDIQRMLIPAFMIAKPELPKTYGKEIVIKQQAQNVCQPKPVWSNYYAGDDFERAVICKINPPPISGGADSKMCTLGPDGVINCQRDEPLEGSASKVFDGEKDTKVQVRTVFPHLLEISDQTISMIKGLFQIFRPFTTDPKLDFAKVYQPVAAQSQPINYEITKSKGLSLHQKEGGWKIFFYNLGGAWNARNFVLRLINPPENQTKP